MENNQLKRGYDPKQVEEKCYNFWEEQGLFTALEKSGKKGYSIVIPPPNVTGVLHMGHALNNTMQDILCRYRRLKGDNVLWMPGTDHAGIATQNVVEKMLAKKGLDRHQLGRDKFIEEVWKWREKYGGAIINQLKRLGASCDWEKERFTMDPGLSRAVREVFVKLYNDGLIYRGNYIINWCKRCRTALADLEVEHQDHSGELYYIKYPFPGKTSGIVVATTRPETMLGDVAVAVNPDDERFKNLKSESVILPIVNREIPIIRDKYVDMSFGTGGLKVTPAHDSNDFEIGKRHNLECIKIIDEDGLMNSFAGEFKSMDSLKCRKAIVESLKEEGLLEKIEPYETSIGHCYRCGEIIEPTLSKQWFIKTKPLAKEAILAVKEGQTKIIPSVWNKTYFDWMENIKDWCISRQIWWGHRIPAWTCASCKELTVSVEIPETCPLCGKEEMLQETDVLDTWFSSALWPFSTMGWPDQTDLLKRFYPTSVLVTGFDILFFWVARMMMMGLYFMKEVPFKDVYVHALVRDENGKKMSKSTGNVIDPLTIIEEYGTDAFRFTLAAFAAQGRDIKMSEKRVQGYRHFINKLWNAARFALIYLEKGYTKIDYNSLETHDQWILLRLQSTAIEVEEALNTYRFNDGASALYRFVWHELCDWYLEAIKPELYGEKGEQRKDDVLCVLWHVLRDTMILLHPFIPFVTEEVWDHLPGVQGSIMQACYPKTDHKIPKSAESDMELIMSVITGIRNIRGEMNIQPSLKLEAIVQIEDKPKKEKIEQHRDLIVNLARLESLSIEQPGPEPKSAATVVIHDATIFVPLKGIIDFNQESSRLEKEISKLDSEMQGLIKKLNNEDFLKRAPANVVEKVKEKNKTIVKKREKLETTLERIKKIITKK